MIVNYTCPCCLHRGKISQEFCDLVQAVVREYLEKNDVPTFHYVSHYGNSTADAKTSERMWAIYFIRKMTGALNKDIAPYVHLAGSVPARYHAIVVSNMIRNPDFVVCEIEMMAMIQNRFLNHLLFTQNLEQ